MVAFARILGADKDRAKKEMNDALEFEMKLIKVNKFTSFFLLIQMFFNRFVIYFYLFKFK